MTGLHTAGSWKKMIFLMAALGLLLAVQLTGMSAASAAPSHPASYVTQLNGAHPDTTPSGQFEVGDPYYGNDFWFMNCTAGNHSAPPHLSSPTPGSTFVHSYCNVRVWLAQYSNGTGYKLCVSPGDFVIIYRSYRDIGVSTNGSHC
jgi:hypothetical protein